MTAIDTHCHLDILENKGISVETALKNAAESGVEGIIQIATDLKSSRRNLELAQKFSNSDISPDMNMADKFPDLYWTAGIHPGSVGGDENLNGTLALINEFHQHEQFIGVGETGLDYYHDTSKMELQKKSLAAHLEIAAKLHLPVVMHLRDSNKHEAGNIRAFQDALQIVNNQPNCFGTLHCFTYGYEEAKQFIDLGWYISYSGVITYKNAESVQDSACRLPLERIMIETDAPFLSPNPRRGEINQPAYLMHTLDYISELRSKHTNEEPELIKKTILENSKKFIHWKKNNA